MTNNPRDFTLGQIETLALTEHVNWPLPHVRDLIVFIETCQKKAQEYQVQKVIEMKKRTEENGSVKHRSVTVDTRLVTPCVLVSE